MSVLVGSVNIRALENAGINGSDVREWVLRQFGSALLVDTDFARNALNFFVDGPYVQKWRDQVLTISGKHGAYSVALHLPPTQHTAQTKVVPTSSKKLLLL